MSAVQRCDPQRASSKQRYLAAWHILSGRVDDLFLQVRALGHGHTLRRGVRQVQSANVNTPTTLITANIVAPTEEKSVETSMAIATIEHAVPMRKKLQAASSSHFISLFTKV